MLFFPEVITAGFSEGKKIYYNMQDLVRGQLYNAVTQKKHTITQQGGKDEK